MSLAYEIQRNRRLWPAEFAELDRIQIYNEDAATQHLICEAFFAGAIMSRYLVQLWLAEQAQQERREAAE